MYTQPLPDAIRLAATQMLARVEKGPDRLAMNAMAAPVAPHARPRRRESRLAQAHAFYKHNEDEMEGILDDTIPSLAPGTPSMDDAPDPEPLLPAEVVLGEARQTQPQVPLRETSSGPKELLLDTSLGKIGIRLRADAAPHAAHLFEKMVGKKLYDGCVFYRSEPGFVVQGGLRLPDGTFRHNPFGHFPLEYKLPNKRGTVTLARFQDPNSGSGEFFINLKDNPSLDRTGSPGYGQGFEVFGEVADERSMAIVEAISHRSASFDPKYKMRMLQSPVLIKHASVVELAAHPAAVAVRHPVAAAQHTPHGGAIVFDTTAGRIRMTLRADAAPHAAKMLQEMVEDKVYDGCTFYRAEPGFVVQGGLRTAAGEVRRNPLGNFPFEYKLKNKRGTVSMARLLDPNSGSGEFFINLNDNPSLDRTGQPGYGQGFEVFAEVDEAGLRVAEAISRGETVSQNGIHMLMSPIVIRRAIFEAA